MLNKKELDALKRELAEAVEAHRAAGETMLAAIKSGQGITNAKAADKTAEKRKNELASKYKKMLDDM